MKILWTKGVATLMALVLCLSIQGGTLVSAEVDGDHIETFVSELLAVNQRGELIELLTLLYDLDNKAGFIAAYEAAFNQLGGSQQDRLAAFGVTLDSLEALSNFSISNAGEFETLIGYIQSGNADSLKAALTARKAAFEAAMAGVDFSQLNAGFARMDKVFMLNALVRSLNVNIGFLNASTAYGNMTLNTSRAEDLIDVANDFILNNGIENKEPVLNGLQVFVTYYNASSNPDRTSIYDYLYDHNYVALTTTPIPPGPTPPGPTPPGPTPPGPTPGTDEELVDIDDPDEPLPEAGPGMLFEDIEGVRSWAGEAIEALFIAGVINGRSATIFDPNANITRGEFAKMLAVLLNLMIDDDATSVFEDVKNTDWFRPYVMAAFDAEIVNGKSATHFGPHDQITRDEMATMLGRVLVAAGYEVPTEDVLEVLIADFTDFETVRAFALDYAYLCVDLGIINGRPVADGVIFAPLANATRAEAAVMLYRFSAFVETILDENEVEEETETEEETEEEIETEEEA